MIARECPTCKGSGKFRSGWCGGFVDTCAYCHGTGLRDREAEEKAKSKAQKVSLIIGIICIAIIELFIFLLSCGVDLADLG
jgi:RecJ-like exonuclease